jgi:hypothetical protein
MTWRSTAVVSGAGLLATWLASAPPSTFQITPKPLPAAPQAAEQTAAMSAEIQREADRLHARLRAEAMFREPSRNPFRFGARVPARVPPPVVPPTITEEPMTAAVPEQPTLRITLAGIAEEKVDGEIVRTAIVSTPSDVLLVKEGEQIGDQYKVVKIGADAIELTRLDDGAVVRLALKP